MGGKYAYMLLYKIVVDWYRIPMLKMGCPDYQDRFTKTASGASRKRFSRWFNPHRKDSL